MNKMHIFSSLVITLLSHSFLESSEKPTGNASELDAARSVFLGLSAINLKDIARKQGEYTAVMLQATQASSTARSWPQAVTPPEPKDQSAAASAAPVSNLAAALIVVAEQQGKDDGSLSIDDGSRRFVSCGPPPKELGGKLHAQHSELSNLAELNLAELTELSDLLTAVDEGALPGAAARPVQNPAGRNATQGVGQQHPQSILDFIASLWNS